MWPLLLFGALALEGCSLFRGSKEEEKTPAQLMSEGLENLEKGYYEASAEAFQKVKDRYPYSEQAVMAELKMADALYKKGQFEEAYSGYMDFEKLHPKNPNLPYVLYQKGMCHYERVSSIDRDPAPAVQAKEEFERLVKKYPKDVYARKALLKIRACYIQIAQHELYVARFYFNRGYYRAAMGRYMDVLQNYPDVGQYQEALHFLGRCRDRLSEAPGKG
jgi:outer membrane protein assembly factor BamD